MFGFSNSKVFQYIQKIVNEMAEEVVTRYGAPNIYLLTIPGMFLVKIWIFGSLFTDIIH